jgi:hypothetical protein
MTEKEKEESLKRVDRLSLILKDAIKSNALAVNIE